MIEPQAVVAAGAAALAEAQLAERQREVVGHDQQVDQRGVLAGQDLADRQARVVHERERLDQDQVETAEAALDHRARRRASRPRPDQPARSASRSRTIQPRYGASWRTGCPDCPGRRRSSPPLRDMPKARSAPWRVHADRTQTVRGGPAAMVSAPPGRRAPGRQEVRLEIPRVSSSRGPRSRTAGPARGRASPLPRRVRRGPSRRCGACRG